MKKLFSLLLVTVLVCALCLCAASCKSSESDKEDNNSVADTIPGGTTDVSAEVLEALSNSGDVLVYSFSEGDLSNSEVDFADYFEQIYGGTVTYKQVVWEGWENSFINDFAAEEAPDVVALWYKLWPKVANRSMVYSLDALTEQGVVALDHPVFEPERELCENNFTYKKSNYGVAIEGGSAVYCGVNTDLFKQYGVKSPVEYYNEGTWTIDTLIQCCTELTRDTDNDSVVDVFGYNGWDLDWFVVANGGQLLEMDEEGKIYDCFDNVEVLNGLEYVADLYNVKKAATISDSWQGGRIGMYAALKQNVGRKIVEDEVTFNWDIVPFPKGKDNKTGVMPGDINAYGVSTSTKNPQGAVNYILARKVFNELVKDKYPDEKMSKYTEDQITMFSDYDLKAENAFFMGVGTLWGSQWDFWYAMQHNDGGVSEVLASHRPMFQAQCELEMESVTE